MWTNFGVFVSVEKTEFTNFVASLSNSKASENVSIVEIIVFCAFVSCGKSNPLFTLLPRSVIRDP